MRLVPEFYFGKWLVGSVGFLGLSCYTPDPTLSRNGGKGLAAGAEGGGA